MRTYFNCHSHRKPGTKEIFSCRNAYHFLSEKSISKLTYPVSVGFHPWHARDFSLEKLGLLQRLCQLPQVVALGEAGLDKCHGPNAIWQMECWKAQFALAQETGMPLIVHCVRAWEEMLPFVRSTKVPMMFHDFRGSPQLMEVFSKLKGIYFSFGISLLHSAKCRLLFRLVPEDRFLLESDQANINIEAVYLKAAEIRGTDSSEITSQMRKNVAAFFRKREF